MHFVQYYSYNHKNIFILKDKTNRILWHSYTVHSQQSALIISNKDFSNHSLTY